MITVACCLTRSARAFWQGERARFTPPCLTVAYFIDVVTVTSLFAALILYVVARSSMPFYVEPGECDGIVVRVKTLFGEGDSDRFIRSQDCLCFI